MVKDMIKYTKKRAAQKSSPKQINLHVCLAIEHSGMDQVVPGGIIDKETGAVLDYRDDLRRHFRGNGRAAEGSPHHAIFLQDVPAYISGAMDHDSALPGIVIETLIHAVYPQGK